MTIVISIVQAARYDDLDDVIGLESAGVSLDAKDSQGRTGSNVSIFLSSTFFFLCYWSHVMVAYSDTNTKTIEIFTVGLSILLISSDTCILNLPAFAYIPLILHLQTLQGADSEFWIILCLAILVPFDLAFLLNQMMKLLDMSYNNMVVGRIGKHGAE